MSDKPSEADEKLAEKFCAMHVSISWCYDAKIELAEIVRQVRAEGRSEIDAELKSEAWRDSWRLMQMAGVFHVLDMRRDGNHCFATGATALAAVQAALETAKGKTTDEPRS